MNRFVLAVLLVCALASAAPAQLVFEPRQSCAAVGGNYNPRVDLGDVDGDGDLDAVAGTDFDVFFVSYEVLLNDGAGQLASDHSVSTTDVALALRLADADGDGLLDLLTAGGDALYLRRGLGAGHFGAAEAVYLSASASALHFDVVEVTGDVAPDLVALDGTTLAVLRGLGDGAFEARLPPIDLAPYTPYAARPGDFDGDGLVDLIVLARSDPPLTGASCVGWSLQAERDGSFTPRLIGTLGSRADAELADLDGDGRADLITSSSRGVAVRLGDGSEVGFGREVSLHSADYGSGFAAADYDGDGRLDLAAVLATAGELVFSRGDGAGGFTEGLRVSNTELLAGDPEPPFAQRPLRAADMDADGRPDVVRTLGDNFGRILLHRWRNHTYGPGEPFADLGLSLSDPPFTAPGDSVEFPPGGAWSTPILLLDGGLQAGQSVQMRIARQGVESGTAWLMLGWSSLLLPFHGGTLVPMPDLLVGPLAIEAFAVAEVSATVPSGLPPGFEVWVQAWFVPQQPGQDFAATSGAIITAP